MYNGNYIQFYVGKEKVMASDGIRPIDARMGVLRLCDIAFAKINQTYFRDRSYDGFDIFKTGRKIYSIRGVKWIYI